MQPFNYTLIISCSLEKPIITNKIVKEIGLFCASSPKFLWPNVAVEFSLYNKKIKNNFLDKIRNYLKKFKIDVNIVKYNNFSPRKKKLLLADMDSTLIQSESLDDLAEIYELGEEVRQITSEAMNGKINYKVSLEKRVKLFKSLPSNPIAKLKQKLDYNDGASELISTMKKYGATCGLATGGFNIIAQKVKSDLNLDFIQANQIEIIDQRYTGKLIEPILDQESKLKFLQELIKKLKITNQNTCTIGDGANDIQMIKYSGMGVAFKGKDKLKKNASYILDFSDLTGLLFLQGYTKNQIKTN